MEVVSAPQISAATRTPPILEEEEELFRLQLSVAKRADELAQRGTTTRCAETDRTTWLLAETQVLTGLGAAAV